MDEKIKALFPLKGEITQEIIDKAEIMNTQNCIGALTLKEALQGKVPDEIANKSRWGAIHGENDFYGEKFLLTTEERVNFMDVRNPQNVTFILEKY